MTKDETAKEVVGGPCVNTDRELWRERTEFSDRNGDFYADSIHITKGGGIGINCGGNVIVMPIRDWHKAATLLTQQDGKERAKLTGVELHCDDCQMPYATWFAPNPVWNLVMGGPDARDDPGGMLCPRCFTLRAEAAGVKPTAWEVRPENLGDAPVRSPHPQEPNSAEDEDGLKPCPFCGGEAEQIDIEEEGGNFGGSCIGCKRCRASSPVHFDRKENLRSSWNDRRQEPNSALIRENEELRARVVELEGHLNALGQFRTALTGGSE